MLKLRHRGAYYAACTLENGKQVDSIPKTYTGGAVDREGYKYYYLKGFLHNTKGFATIRFSPTSVDANGMYYIEGFYLKPTAKIILAKQSS